MTELNTEIRKRKIAQIHCLSRDLCMDNYLLHVAVHGITGKESIKKLTLNQLIAVIKVLTKMKRRNRQYTYRKNTVLADRGVYMLATPAQRELVEKLMSVITDKLSLQYPDKYLESICKKTFQRPYQKLNRFEMKNLIEALKSIQNRKEGVK